MTQRISRRKCCHRSYPVHALFSCSISWENSGRDKKTSVEKQVSIPLLQGKYFPVVDCCAPAAPGVGTEISSSVLLQCRHGSTGCLDARTKYICLLSTRAGTDSLCLIPIIHSPIVGCLSPIIDSPIVLLVQLSDNRQSTSSRKINSIIDSSIV